MINNYILLAVSPCLGTAKNLISKAGGNKAKDLKNLLWLNVFTSILALLVFGIASSDILGVISGSFMLLAGLYGLFTMFSQLFYIIAVEKGSVAICSLIYSSGFLIPTVFSAIFFKEKLAALKIIGIIFLLISLWIITGKKQGGINQKSIIFALLAMASSGIIGVLQKLFTYYNSKDFLNEYLFIAFLFMLVFTVCIQILLFILRKKKNNLKKFFIEGKTETVSAKNIILMFTLFTALGLCTVFANKLNLYLSGVISGMIFFPIVNGGCIALSALFSEIIFKEKLTLMKRIGIIISIFSIVLISIK